MQADAETHATGFGRWAIPLAWLVAAIGAVTVVASAYAGRDEWFGDSSPYAALGALAMGFVGRVSASVTGAAVVVALGALALLPVVG
jgi:hypothetical protein